MLFMDQETLRDPTKNVRGGVPVLFPTPGKRSTGPTEGENEAAALIEEAAYRSLAAEREKQQIAGDDRRHDQGQMNDPIEQGPAGKPAARQDISERHAERQRNDRGDTRHPEAQKNGGPVRIR